MFIVKCQSFQTVKNFDVNVVGIYTSFHFKLTYIRNQRKTFVSIRFRKNKAMEVL